MRHRPMGIQKHPPYSIPETARGEIMKLSKATIAEIAWDLAKQQVGGDEASEAETLREIDRRRQIVKAAR